MGLRALELPDMDKLQSDPDALSPPLPSLVEGRFMGLQTFQDNVRRILSTAASQGWSEIILSDTDFADWPLGESAVVQSLSDWSKRGRKFTLMAQSFSELPRRHPRFVQWRQRWDHVIECRRCGVGHQDSFNRAVWTPGWMLQRLDGDLYEGVLSREPSRRFQLRERLVESLKTSAPGFPATTLGL